MKDSIDPGRMAFKSLNTFMVFLWRMGLGKMLSIWPEVFGNYMVITHSGRHSGRHYRTPVNYAEVDGEIYCVAGFGQDSDWYRNIVSNPQIEVWLPDGWYAGTAQDTEINAHTLSALRRVLINSGFVARLMGIHPKSISDDLLLEYCKDYRLIRVDRSAARTGANGPGDLAWLWPIILVYILLKKAAQKKK